MHVHAGPGTYVYYIFTVLLILALISCMARNDCQPTIATQITVGVVMKACILAQKQTTQLQNVLYTNQLKL